MSYDTYHKRKIGNHVLKPETQMMGYGFDPSLSEGSLKPPIFLTSTFVFRTAQDGKDFFDYTSGRRELLAGQSSGLVYSRFNNPNLEVLEDRLALWEEGEAAAVFSSGMSAISTVIWTHVRPGDVVLMSQPLYGGTETLIEKTLPGFGVSAVGFNLGHDRSAVLDAAHEKFSTALPWYERAWEFFLLGAEHLIFGSDFPHVEGLAEPLSYLDAPSILKTSRQLLQTPKRAPAANREQLFSHLPCFYSSNSFKAQVGRLLLMWL